MISPKRYDIGVETPLHKGKVTTTSVGNKDYDSFLLDLGVITEYQVGYVPTGFEHRPDLISEVFYNTPNYWWLLLLYNNISDPFEGLNVGDRILIPKI